MTKRKRILLIVVILLIVIIGISWHYYAKAKSAKAAMAGMPPTAVQSTKAFNRDWQQQIQSTGTLNAEQGVMLKAETAGRITKIFIQSGQEVKEGDPLFEINPAILEAQLAADEAQVVLHTGNYDRALALYKKGSLAKQDLDTSLANKNAAIANADAIKAQLTQNIIRAPFSGKLGIRLFNLGDYIDEGQSLINLQAIDPLRVDFTVPENIAGQVKIGDTLYIQSSAYLNKYFKGNVSAIDSAIDTASRTLLVRAIIPNPQKLLLPGNFVQVRLLVGKAFPMVTIPQIAVVYDTNSNYVYIIQKGHAVKTDVTLGEQNDSLVAIKSGLKIGDDVVTDGQIKLMDGAPVMSMPPAANKTKGK